MPHVNKKRGRRAEKKRALEVEGANAEPVATKRQKVDQAVDNGNMQDEEVEFTADYVHIPMIDGQEDVPSAIMDRPFYGLLDEEEQTYFRKAGEMLELNQFPGPDDRLAFVESVYKEAENKELKIANSQSCSRVMELLIQHSTKTQLKLLFQKFTSNFISLFGHRFASHCCECLFIQSAPVVTEELKATRKTDGNAIFAHDEAKMEDLFISVITEIEENLGYLMTNTFASHPLRVLLLILSGEPIIPAANKHVLHSRRKEHVAIVGFKEHLDNSLREEREVPTAFTQSLESIIYKSIAGLDTNQLRSLSAHKTGNPILQLLLRLELSKFGKQRGKQEHSILHTLLPDNALTSDSSSSAFVTGLIYDTIGSRLLETVIEFAPAKTFKAIYKGWFKDKLSPLCKNDTAAYVVCKALNRIGKEDLQDAISVLGPEIPSLVERNRHNVIRTLVDRAVQRDLDLRPLEKYISASFTGTNETFDLPRLLKITSHVDPQSTTIPKPPHRQPKDSKATHASLLAQSILSAPAPLSTGPLTSLTQLPTPLLLTLAHSPTYSPLLTIFLTLKSTTNPSQRRKLISSLYGHFSSLALDPSGSRVVEAVWPGTRGLAFMRERVAEELAESESALKSSPSGKHVWRTWQMDEYRRRRRDWVARSRDEAGTDGFVGFPDEAPMEDKAGQQQRGVAGAAGAPKGRHMTALQRARERHAKEKMRKEMAGTPATGANATF